MPEGPELRIMSDYINQSASEKTFNKSFHIERGNNPVVFKLLEEFKVSAESFGKELVLSFYHDVTSFKFSVFMGMSGNWKFVETKNWNDTKFVRMRLDTIDGYSLLLYGSYMGPKYKLGGFTGVKRGPDPTKQFEEFKSNVLDNLGKKDFDKPICEALLNQKYFNGIGNYLRSTILYYLDVNPFEGARDIIKNNPTILDMCRDISLKSYQLNGGQLTDWRNPFDTDYQDFIDWVYYQKGKSMKDSNGRTFWYHPKWETFK
jgi:endonuclease VIII-like 1